jgi:T-complex protein 1 subunit eta
MQPRILLLKEGTENSQGKAQIFSNIAACEAIGSIVQTTLGPRGMDKLIHDGNDVTVTNDGATVLRKLNIVHPAARVLFDISRAQDDEVGDGTTSVVVLAVEFLKQAKQFLEEQLAPQLIIKSYKKACELALKRIDELALDLSKKSHEAKFELLKKCAETALNSKLVSREKSFFADMIVDAVLSLDESSGVNMIGLKKVTGGALGDSRLVNGVAFKKTFSYAGFEQQPKSFTSPKILLLNLELELKAEKDNAEIRISQPEEYQQIVDAEWRIIYEKLEKIVESGAQVVLSRLPIGDLATQYFADRHIFCAGRVDEADMARTRLATGAEIQTTVHGLASDVLGSCGKFEEVQIGSERWNIFSDCPNAKTATIILRGGAHQFLEEADRSLHDAIMIVRRAQKTERVVGGGGAIDLEISKTLKEYSRTVSGAEQSVIAAFGKAFEVIPRCLAINSGADATNVLNELRTAHAKQDGVWMGVDCYNCSTIDSMNAYIWEPAIVKRNAIASATEAACLILSIDETVKNPQSEQPQGGGKGKGKGMRR